MSIIEFFNNPIINALSGIITFIIGALTLYYYKLFLPVLKIEDIEIYFPKENAILLTFFAVNPSLRDISIKKIYLKYNGNITNPLFVGEAETVKFIVPAKKVGYLGNNYCTYEKKLTCTAKPQKINPGLILDYSILFGINDLNNFNISKVELILETSQRKKRMPLSDKMIIEQPETLKTNQK